jgi:hypothetical protein
MFWHATSGTFAGYDNIHNIMRPVDPTKTAEIIMCMQSQTQPSFFQISPS